MMKNKLTGITAKSLNIHVYLPLNFLKYISNAPNAIAFAVKFGSSIPFSIHRMKKSSIQERVRERTTR